jgi:hypothetical protein
MTTEEIEASQSGVEDGGMGGPGAPTPLSALEVSLHYRRNPKTYLMCFATGHCWSNETRYSIDC